MEDIVTKIKKYPKQWLEYVERMHPNRPPKLLLESEETQDSHINYGDTSYNFYIKQNKSFKIKQNNF